MQSNAQLLINFRIMKQWIAAQHEKLLVKYKNSWIAVADKKVVDHGRDIDKNAIAASS